MNEVIYQNTNSSRIFTNSKDDIHFEEKDTKKLSKLQSDIDSFNSAKARDEDALSNKINNDNSVCSSDSYCQIKLDSILQLKSSTRQLLCLLEEIQTKINSNYFESKEKIKLSYIVDNETNVATGEYNSVALKKLRNQIQYIESIDVENQEDDCSVYKRLTRKCHCMNHPDYNDFVMHFNEDTKYNTSNLGEIIKNLRILRKFLYMGGNNTNNALMFLNEGLVDSQLTEKEQIALGCINADICNVFEDHSIVVVCISWPCKYRHYGNYITQNLAAGFLYKLAELDEGRRYLNFTSRITNDIRKVLRNKSSNLEIEVVDSLNATLNILKPNFSKDYASKYFSKSVYEGIGTRTIRDLMQHQQHMNRNEIFTNLHLLHNYSSFQCGREELKNQLPPLLIVFKYLMIEYDDSELNIIITNILNNLVTNNKIKLQKSLTFKSLVEPIMKNEACQIQIRKRIKKLPEVNYRLSVSPKKHCQLLKKKDLAKSIIIVPIEKKK